MGTYNNYQIFRSCYILIPPLFTFWAHVAQPDPKGISLIAEVVWKDLSTGYCTQSAAQQDTKLERNIHQISGILPL